MSLCVLAGGKITVIAATAFSLSWIHSVEKIEWQEDWAIVDAEFVLTEARVKGSGAGMDPGAGARLVDGWWTWHPEAPPVGTLHLAASGTTVSGWKICYGPQDDCTVFGEMAGDTIALAECGPEGG